ncbi:hypothetical protein [Streptomyces sp. NPDC006739]|uniref:hypothetical protein n=1 Tax=Streptomyces sp. NPDC006739 TaxID=3364763 RepID=UPI0036AA8432
MAESGGTQSVLLKVAVTGALGTGTYVVTNLFQASEVAKITLTFLIAGSALIVQFMIDFEKGTRRLAEALEAHERAVETRVRDGFVRMGDISEFLGRLDDDTDRFKEVERLVRNVAALDPRPDPLVQAFADAELKRVAKLMGDLSGSHVDYEGEDRDWLLTLVTKVRRTIDAASTHDDLDFWKTDLGRRYLIEQHRAIRTREVEIRRLIIVDSPDRIDDMLRRLREQQELLGIKVKFAALSTLPHHLRISPVHNFVVFDGAISYEVSPELEGRGAEADPVPPLIASTKLVLGLDEVATRVVRFDELWAEGN